MELEPYINHRRKRRANCDLSKIISYIKFQACTKSILIVGNRILVRQEELLKLELKKHQLHCSKGNLDKSAVAEHWYEPWYVENPFISRIRRCYTKAAII